MRENIDALFDWIETNWDNISHITIFADLYGILYQIGSEWEHYQELFD